MKRIVNFLVIFPNLAHLGFPISASDCMPELWKLLEQLLILQVQLEECKKKLEEFRTRLTAMRKVILHHLNILESPIYGGPIVT